MTEKQRLVFSALKILGEHRPHDLAKRMGYTESAYISQQLSALYKKGLINKKGSGKKTTYKINEKYLN